MSTKKFMKVTREGSPEEQMVSVINAVMHSVKQIGDPALWNHKITFRGNSVYVEFELRPSAYAEAPK